MVFMAYTWGCPKYSELLSDLSSKAIRKNVHQLNPNWLYYSELRYGQTISKSEDLDKPFKLCLDHWWHTRSSLMIYVQPIQPKNWFKPIRPGSLRRIALSEITEVANSLLGQHKGDETHYWRTSPKIGWMILSVETFDLPLVNDHIAGWNISIFNRNTSSKRGHFPASYISLLECRWRLYLWCADLHSRSASSFQKKKLNGQWGVGVNNRSGSHILQCNFYSTTIQYIIIIISRDLRSMPMPLFFHPPLVNWSPVSNPGTCLRQPIVRFRSIKGTNPRTSYLGLWTRETRKDETSRSGQIGDLKGNLAWWNIIIWPDQDSPRSCFFDTNIRIVQIQNGKKSNEECPEAGVIKPRNHGEILHIINGTDFLSR